MSAPVPFGFEPIRTWLGLSLEGLGTKGSGPGLDNDKYIKHPSYPFGITDFIFIPRT